MDNGYYWIRHSEGTTFMALLEAGCWYVPGVREVADIEPFQVISEVEGPRLDKGTTILSPALVVPPLAPLH